MSRHFIKVCDRVIGFKKFRGASRHKKREKKKEKRAKEPESKALRKSPRGTTHNTKTVVAVALVRASVVANRRTTIPRIADPGTAPQRPISFLIIRQPGSIAVSFQAIRFIGVVAVPMICTPFPHVPVQVIQPPSIRRKTAYRRGFTPANSFRSIVVCGIPIVICQVCGDHFSIVKRGARSSTTSIFPLGFGW